MRGSRGIREPCYLRKESPLFWNIKVCTRCKESLPADFRFFYHARRSRDRLAYSCKECERKGALLSYHRFPDKKKSSVYQWRKRNEGLVRARDRLRAYRPDPRSLWSEEKKAKDAAYHKRYHLENLERTRQHTRDRKKEDVAFRIGCTLRRRVSQAVKGKGRKAARSRALIGCSPAELKAYLEARLLPGMTWENYGHHGWHIDHIKPCAGFDLSDPDQQRQCFHYTNLQPLWAKDNLSKGKKHVASEQTAP